MPPEAAGCWPAATGPPSFRSHGHMLSFDKGPVRVPKNSLLPNFTLQQPWQPQPASDPHYHRPEWHDEWTMQPELQWQFEQPADQAFCCPPGAKQTQQSMASLLVDPCPQQLEASGSPPLSGQLTTLGQPAAQYGRQQEPLFSPPSPRHAASLGRLPSLGSLPPLSSPLIAAAVPAADVPVHVGHFAFCRMPPPPAERRAQQPRTVQPPSQESHAGLVRRLQGDAPSREGASSELPPVQPCQPVSRGGRLCSACCVCSSSAGSQGWRAVWLMPVPCKRHDGWRSLPCSLLLLCLQAGNGGLEMLHAAGPDVPDDQVGSGRTQCVCVCVHSHLHVLACSTSAAWCTAWYADGGCHSFGLCSA